MRSKGCVRGRSESLRFGEGNWKEQRISDGDIEQRSENWKEKEINELLIFVKESIPKMKDFTLQI